MRTKNISVKGVDIKIWQQFTGYCKTKNVSIGYSISVIIAQYLKKI